MEQRDTLNLVDRVAHLCPAMRIETETWKAWHDVIGHLDAEDALAACRQIAARKPFIAPADIIETVETIRRKRADAAGHIFEPRDGESDADAMQRLRHERALAASGQLAAQPLRLALAPGQNGPVRLPDTIAKVVGKVREARENPARKIPCPVAWCPAQAGQWCERRQGGNGTQPVAGFLHPSRCEAAGVRFVPAVPPRAGYSTGETDGAAQ